MITIDQAHHVTAAHPDRLYIGGEWITVEDPTPFEVVNPATGQGLVSVVAAGAAEVEKAVAAARKAFDEGPWPRMKPAERAAVIRRLASAIESRAATFADLWTLQVGVPATMSKPVALGATALLNYYADLVESYPIEDVRPSKGRVGKHAVVISDPVGVVAAITPWNGPLQEIVMKLAPALAAGCTVILKPAMETPLDAYLVAEAAEEVGIPPGVVNLLPADRDVADLLVRHPGVDKVAFTGSTAAGMHIASIVASRMGRYTMELGGKSAAVVLDDYEPETLGSTLTPLITRLSGQICMNYTRVLVPRRTHDAYVEAIAAVMETTRVGDPWDAATDMGPIALKRQLERVEGYIDIGVDEGADLVTGGRFKEGEHEGFFVQPTLFAGATNDMRIAREEIFGPVATVIPYDSVEEAIRIANDSDYGLSGAVFTHDTDRAYEVARGVRTGHFTQNGRDFDYANPFGGYKKSGYGRELGREGLEAFLEVKSVFLPVLPSSLSALG